MTKGVAVGALLAFVLLAGLPGALAHGAPPVRAIDTRVLLDDDGPLGFGGCLEGTCALPVGAAADLLALDVREAHLPDGAPALVFRLVLQSEEAPAGSSLALGFTASGTARTFTFTSADGAAWTSADVDRLDGPFPVGDGHPKALDAWVRAAALGVAAGDVLADLAVTSSRDGTPDDVMPGGWFAQGVEVAAPSLPGAAATAPAYTLQGPADLLAVEATPANGLVAPATVALRLTNLVPFPQFVDLALLLPAGVTGRLDQPAVNLDASGAREVGLLLTGASVPSTVRIIAVSDLGAYQVLELPVTGPATVGNATGGPGDADAGPGDHPAAGNHDAEPRSKDAPALEALPLGLGLCALLLALSRRR